MTDATKIKQLRSTVNRLLDYCGREPTHSGIPFDRTPLSQAARKVLADTAPEDEGGQQRLGGVA
jgi:hypothetical protein